MTKQHEPTGRMIEYEKRLRRRDISAFDSATLDGKLGANDPKFKSNGEAKPFYGLTCIAWVGPETELFVKLCDLQRTLRDKFIEAELESIFSFLDPASFHMTICDIEAGSMPARSQHFEDRIKQVRNAFSYIGAPGKVSAQIRGVGLARTITALVRFDSALELQKVLSMEQTIKEMTHENVRAFTGHISFAYFVQHPGEDIGAVKEVLLPYADRAFGEFTFSQFDLTYFIDMNTYIPILTTDLENGKVMHHDNNVVKLTASQNEDRVGADLNHLSGERLLELVRVPEEEGDLPVSDE